MVQKVKDLAVKVGTYTKDGQDRNRYLNIGAVMQSDDGREFLLINRAWNPAGVPNPDNRDTVLVGMFDPREADAPAPAPAPAARQAAPRQAPRRAAPADDFADDVPF